MKHWFHSQHHRKEGKVLGWIDRQVGWWWSGWALEPHCSESHVAIMYTYTRPVTLSSCHNLADLHFASLQEDFSTFYLTELRLNNIQ
jgi:hypothetical protein